MPYLKCDTPDPSEPVEYYTLAGLPGNPTVQRDPSGEYGFKADISNLPLGDYSVRVSACNDWSCSLPAPLEFTALGRPSPPTGLSILDT